MHLLRAEVISGKGADEPGNVRRPTRHESPAPPDPVALRPCLEFCRGISRRRPRDRNEENVTPEPVAEKTLEPGEITPLAIANETTFGIEEAEDDHLALD